MNTPALWREVRNMSVTLSLVCLVLVFVAIGNFIVFDALAARFLSAVTMVWMLYVAVDSARIARECHRELLNALQGGHDD
jgi:hypothetical protein